MKIVKKIGIALLAIIALLLVVAAILPKEYVVTSSIVIRKPKAEVFNYVKLIRNQEKYSVWVTQDPNIKMTYTGTDGTIGFKAAWDSKDDNVGAGSQTITALTDSRMDVDLHFERPMKGDDKAATFVEAISETETKVTNEFYGKSDFPLNLLSLWVGKRFIQQAEDQNMANLKRILEGK